jgi:hypothetical protein
MVLSDARTSSTTIGRKAGSGVTDTTTPAATDSGDAGQDWQAKYSGAQIALNKKHDALTVAERRAQESSERASALEAELDAYRAREAASSEENNARALYESLRERFEEEPPTPRGNNAPRDFHRSADDGSAEYAKHQLNAALGIDKSKTSWP